MMFLKNFYTCLLLLFFVNVCAQNSDSLILNGSLFNNFLLDSGEKIKVHQIILKGNKKTKSYILLREIQFKEGDSLPISQLKNNLKLVRQQLYNTTLFN